MQTVSVGLSDWKHTKRSINTLGVWLGLDLFSLGSNIYCTVLYTSCKPLGWVHSINQNLKNDETVRNKSL